MESLNYKKINDILAKPRKDKLKQLEMNLESISILYKEPVSKYFKLLNFLIIAQYSYRQYVNVLEVCVLTKPNYGNLCTDVKDVKLDLA